MFDRRIPISDATELTVDDPLGSIQSMLSALEGFAIAGHSHVAVQHDNIALARPSLAARYAAANSITRRRFDAILREAETVARVGFGVVVSRVGQQDAATIAAARFLGKSLSGSLRRLDELLAPTTA
ncbi:MAG: hypothetical protein EOP61_14015 [Sphingomonadales bacterium]|nr:MAG: hypothetical protein EOP61_14015 [Sphingomonadales bacterium]